MKPRQRRCVGARLCRGAARNGSTDCFRDSGIPSRPPGRIRFLESCDHLTVCSQPRVIRLDGPHGHERVQQAGQQKTGQSNCLLASLADSSKMLTYYGGKVIAKPKVVQVLYGSGTYLSGVAGSGSGTLAGFYQAALNSSYMDMLTQYDTPSQKIGRGSFDSSVQITPSSTRNKSSISDANIQAEIAAQISAGKLPTPDDDTLYMINIPQGKKITMGGASSCSAGGFCAYHSTFKSGSSEVFYGVLPICKRARAARLDAAKAQLLRTRPRSLRMSWSRPSPILRLAWHRISAIRLAGTTQLMAKSAISATHCKARFPATPCKWSGPTATVPASTDSRF